MFKYWIKNRGIYTILLSILLGVFATFVFTKPNINSTGKNLLLSGVYDDTQIDYDIPSPTIKQLEEIKGMDFIDDAFGYYYTDGTLKNNTKNIKTSILFSDNFDSIEMTMYNSKRLISESNSKLSNPIFVDYNFVQANNLKLNDELQYGNIKFQIGKIYQTNSYYKTAVFAPLVGEQKDLVLKAFGNAYSGAFLNVNDDAKADAFLRSYKPLGRLRDRSEFNSDEDYQFHYNNWKNTSYYNEITSFNSKRNSLILEKPISYIIGVVLDYSLIVIIGIALSFRKCEKSIAKFKNEKANKYYFILSNTVEPLMLCLSLIIGAVISFNLTSLFVPSALLTSIIVSIIIGWIIATALLAVYNLIYFKKFIKNK